MKKLIFLIAVFTFFNCQIKAFISESEIEALGIQCNAQRNDIEAVKNLMIPQSGTGQCFMFCALSSMNKLIGINKCVQAYLELTPSGTLDVHKATTLLQSHFRLIGDPQILATIVNFCVQSVAQYYNMRYTCYYGYLIASCGRDTLNQYGLLPSVKINVNGSRSYMQTRDPNVLNPYLN